jgi:SAM-dependent methyltransferase
MVDELRPKRPPTLPDKGYRCRLLLRRHRSRPGPAGDRGFGGIVGGRIPGDGGISACGEVSKPTMTLRLGAIMGSPACGCYAEFLYGVRSTDATSWLERTGTMSNAAFAVRVLQNYGSDKNCPFCDSADTVLMERKKVILHLRRCQSCGLMYRWPKSTASFAERYYQDDYAEANITTEMPEAGVLRDLIATNFAGSARDFHDQLAVLKQFLPGGRVLDFGCSWGYGTFQLRSAGYEVFGFEISRPRAEFGRRELGLEIMDQLEDLDKIPTESVDGIFASHVLEHLLSLKETFANFARILKPNGILMVLVPNGGGKAARELGVRWSMLINEKHTLALDGKFFEKNLTPYGFEVRTTADPYDPDAIGAAVRGHGPLEAEGMELMAIARRVASPTA